MYIIVLTVSNNKSNGLICKNAYLNNNSLRKNEITKN